MKPVMRRTFIGLFTVGIFLVLSNVVFWGLTTFVIFTVLQWMGVL
jgi:hypothetical protein